MRTIFDHEPVPEWLIDELREQVEALLCELGSKRKLDGHVYLTDAIVQTVQDPQRIRYITKELYPDLARSHGTDASNVERSMRTTVARCWREGREALDEVAGHHLEKRPTNSEFIEFVANYIRNGK